MVNGATRAPQAGPLESEITRAPKVAFLNSVFLFAGIAAFAMGFYRWQASAVVGTIDFSFAACNFALLLYLNRHKEQVPLLSWIALVLSYALFTAIYLLVPYNTTRASLFLLLAASAFFLKGRTIGLASVIFILLTIAVAYVQPWFDTGYSGLDVFTTGLYLAALYVIFLNYERVKERATQRDVEKEVLRRSEDRLRALIENASDVIAVARFDGTVAYVSPAVNAIGGYDPAELVGRSYRDLLFPDQLGILRGYLAALAAAPGKVLPMELRFRHKDGSARDIECLARNLVGMPGIDGIVVNLRDVTERKRAAEALRQANRELRLLSERNQIAAAVIESSVEGIMVTDAQSRIESVSPAFERITGFPAAEVVGQRPNLLVSGKHDDAFFRQMYQGLQAEGHWHGEIWNRRRNGELYPQETVINVLRDADGRITHYASVFSDSTVRNQMEARLRELSAMDGLTRIANRRVFDETLAREWARALREGRPLSLLMADIDHFKKYNDCYGHPEGDRCLQAVARAIQGAANRASDLAARYGGEEFAVILPGCDIAGAAAMGERGRAAVAGLAMPHAESSAAAFVTLSVGAATVVPRQAGRQVDLVAAADRALYQAKKQGRNRVVSVTRDGGALPAGAPRETGSTAGPP